MSFSISDFRNNVGALARPNLWRAEIDTNQAGGAAAAPSTFSFRCEKTIAPGRTLATVDDIGFGPALKLPYETTYEDLDVTVICAQDMAERKFFEGWMDNIVYTKSSGSSGKPGLIRFYKDYAEGNYLTIYQMNEVGKDIFKHKLINVYPIRLSAMNLSWEETNTYQRFDVTFAYQYYEWEIPEAA
jgi:hypothetical protein